MATLRQKTAIAHVVAGDAVSKAMLKAGYSPNTSKNPKELTKTPAFQQTMERLGISDDKLSKKLNEGLDATKVVTSPTEMDKEVPDYAVRHKYLETGLKLKGHLKNNDTTINNNVVIPILGGVSVPSHDSNQETAEPQQEN